MVVLNATGIARAAVIVFSNQLRLPLEFQLADYQDGSPAEKRHPYRLAPGQVLPVPVLGEVMFFAEWDDRPREFLLKPNSVYFAGYNTSGLLSLEEVNLDHAGFLAKLDDDRELNRKAALAPVAVIPVKILVDDEEQARPEIWQKRLTDRLAAASDIFERTARVRFRPVAFETWESLDARRDFSASLAEFEREVDPAPARLALGFTSQFHGVERGEPLGGTRGPFRKHLLLREWGNVVTEPERLEILVHELGHWLGAVHSPEPNSVMRTQLGDRQVHSREFQIRFDPLNTLGMYLIGEQLRLHGTNSLSELPQPVRQRMQGIYQVLGSALPDDPAAKVYLRLLHSRPGR